jgi:hypothetical protein
MEELGPIAPALEPLLLAIGRAMLSAAALEKVLLVDIASRRAQREGLTPKLGDDLARLERLPAGALLQRLQELGITLSVRLWKRPQVKEAAATGSALV